jgi:hypothetical protein
VAELLICALLIWLALQVFGQGETLELEELLGLPQLGALAGLAALTGLIWWRSRAYHAAGAGHFPAIGMLGIGACGVLLVLFPTRMPDVVRGGTAMTAFWVVIGWVLLGLALVVALMTEPA